MKILVSILMIVLTYSCGAKNQDDLDFLIGTWKRENREQFEVWENNNTYDLKGHSFRMFDNQKNITETLAIKKIDGHFVYEATVPDQNEGRTIQFKLNSEIDSLYSFENAIHDFPKKIQYKIIDETHLKVIVLGEKDEGFSYVQVMQ